MKLQPALLLALAVPVLGLLSLVIQAELGSRFGAPWEIAIRGHDPRDILRGQYLRYRFDFERGARDKCGPALQALQGEAPASGRLPASR